MASPETGTTHAPKVNLLLLDAVGAAVLAIASVVFAASGKHPGPVALLAAPVCCCTVAWRRRAPVASVIVAVVAIAVFAVSSGGTKLSVEPLAVGLDYYMLGRLATRHGRPRRDVVLLALAVIAIVISPGVPQVIDVATTWALFIGVPFAAGRAIGSRIALTAELRADAQRLEEDQRASARRAAADERNRIARELHDVVAHSVSVMVIQTQAARRVAADDPDAAREALRSVQSCGREALTEMRRMMGVLRHDDEELASGTAPALAQLEVLVARARAAGLPVALLVEGEPRELSPGLELVAFRVVQEALTNAIKHAGPARATVRVTFTAGALELDVSDTGRGPAPADDATDHVGHGLVGMRERLALYGGELDTGRARGGGFRVRARIPLLEAVPS